jgi:hypothetical protein
MVAIRGALVLEADISGKRRSNHREGRGTDGDADHIAVRPVGRQNSLRVEGGFNVGAKHAVG